MDKEHQNIKVLQRLNLFNLKASSDIIADDFVWHYFNPELPEMEGDYKGIAGLADFFKKMAGNTGGSFKVNVISTMPMGDELVVTHVRDTMILKDKPIEVDAVVVWSIADGKIQEAWDIPAVHSVRVLDA